MSATFPPDDEDSEKTERFVVRENVAVFGAQENLSERIGESWRRKRKLGRGKAPNGLLE